MENENKLPPPKSNKHFNLFALGFCFCALILCVVGFSSPDEVYKDLNTNKEVMTSLNLMNTEYRIEKKDKEQTIGELQARIRDLEELINTNSEKWEYLNKERQILQDYIDLKQGKK